MRISTLISEYLLEVILIDRLLENWTDERDLFQRALGCHCSEAAPDYALQVEVLIHHGKGIVGHLCLIHQVF